MSNIDELCKLLQENNIDIDAFITLITYLLNDSKD